MPKENPVKEETRECIVTALIRLTEQKSLSSITITELCKAAGVSRMAFYRNYKSKDDVLASKLNDLINRYRQVTARARANGSPWYGVDHLCTTFVFFRSNQGFMDALLRCGLTHLLANSISSYVIDTWGNGTCEGDYILTGFSGSLLSCYTMWRSRGFKETPAQLADIMSRFYTAIPEASRTDEPATL